MDKTQGHQQLRLSQKDNKQSISMYAKAHAQSDIWPQGIKDVKSMNRKKANLFSQSIKGNLSLWNLICCSFF